MPRQKRKSPGATSLLDITRRGSAADILSEKLSDSIIGQPDAIARIVDAYQMWNVGMEPQGRPVSSFLLLGPTGTGKTHSVEMLARAIHGDSKAILKIDCAEYQHGHEIAKLIGSPPGYLGHKETIPLLSQGNIKKAMSASGVKLAFILFDEIEKASDTLWNLLLGILDKAILTTGDNQPVSFTDCMIFMTSNLGSKEIERALNGRLGFAPVTDPSLATTTRIGTAAAKARFTPEFINRIDRMCVYQPLDRESLEKVLSLELQVVQERVFEAAALHKGLPQFIMNVSKDARDLLLDAGIDPKYGARYLKRTIEKMLIYPIANLTASGQIANASILQVGVKDKELDFTLATAATPSHDNF